MTAISFHFGAPDKLAYTCRLLRKAAARGSAVVVLAESDVVSRLDIDLWGVSEVDFVPHCMRSAAASVLRYSPVVLTSELADGAVASGTVLVQLGSVVPPGAESFGRVIEVVSLDETDRAQARLRWKVYAGRNLPIQKHDLALKESP